MPLQRSACWRKSTYSDQGNGCVEVNCRPDGVTIRDTKLHRSPEIDFTLPQWSAWLAEVASDVSTSTNGAVTVDTTPDGWTVRSLATGVELVYRDHEWDAFRRGAADGEFDADPDAGKVGARFLSV